MKRRAVALLFPLTLLVLALAAFSPGTVWLLQLTPTATATLRPTATLLPTMTPTATALPTATPTPPPSPTPLPTATPTPSPTLPVSPVSTPELLSPLPTPTYPPPPEEVHVPILMYHYISELPADADSIRRGLTIEPAMFEAQLQYLQEHGYTTVTLADVYATLTTGKPLPEKPIVLTFDDGYLDAYTDALPLLQQYGFVGEFFVLATPAHYEAPGYMTWDEIRLLSEAGMSVQGHGRDHYDLRNRAYDFLVYQILGIKEAVEAHTNRPVVFFCYPSGKYDDDVLAVVESAGYWGGVTTEWGATERFDNRYTWPRIRVSGSWSLDTYASVLEGLTP